MKMRNLARTIIITLIFSLLLTALPAQAQQPDGLIVTYPAAQEHVDGTTALAVYFTVTAASAPLLNPPVESATVQLLGADTPPPVSAEVIQPDTPFYVALLLDASGSMAGVMPQVREAASVSLDSAPTNAHFSVIQFSDKPQPVTNFTNDLGRVKKAIADTKSIENGSTCLYDTAYEALDQLEDEVDQPQARRAIILFTDGKDEKGDGSQCSYYGYSDAVNRAREARVPIHTIGLCSNAQCSNLNRADLTKMAQETGGFSYIGNQQEVRQLFQQIMDALNSQMVAQTSVCPHQGDNQAVLSVKLQDREVPLTATFNFASSQNCSLPAGPVGVQIIRPVYEPSENVFNLALSIAGASAIDRLLVQVWDKNDNQFINENKYPPSPSDIKYPAVGMQPGREYCFKVLAFDRQQQPIQKQDGSLILTEMCTRLPEQAPVEFSISAVTPDFEQKKLLIDLNIINLNAQPDKYQIFINDDTGSRVAASDPLVYQQEKQFVIDMPPTMQQLEQPRQYKTTVILITKDDRKSEQEYESKVSPPPPPGWLAWIVSILGQPLVIIGVLGMMIVSMGVAGGWLIARNRQSTEPQLHGFSKKNTAEFHRPPVDPTMLSTDRSGTPQRLRINLTLSNHTHHRQEISQFPCVLGRQSRNLPAYQLTLLENDAGYLLNVPDENISRRHVQFTLHNNKFYVMDLESRNGTFAGDKRLPPKLATPLSMVGPTTIKLGQHVHLEVVPIH